ncbi:hypothetical protein TL16_g02698 [Triparma laevis f. inornata]|uniref:Kinesin light chain n=1 Tax=Triparma laevis f. inornata TaxID=1714386 RepID=A0A9W6ZSX3_9STRA|nr:hypothetical protein TL16_g02698 [Triparma laevis f. inornata]
MRPCGYSATCRECADELRGRNELCPLFRKKIAGFTLGKWQSSIGEHGLWNMTQLVIGEGFNEYFRKQFNGNEEAYLRWREVFDVLEFGNSRDVGPDLPLEQQVLKITKSENLLKLRALAKLCSNDFFNDESLLVVAWRRILEVLVLAMPPVVEKKVRGKKKKQQTKKNDPRKLEKFDACAALGMVCRFVGDFDDARRNHLSVTLREKGQYEEAEEVYKRCLAGRMKVLGKDHDDRLGTLNNLGVVYQRLGNNEKELEYYERALKGYERLLGKNHPQTLMAVMNIAIVYTVQKDYGKADELYERALKGYEAQLGKDQGNTMRCAENYRKCLEKSGK